MDNIAIKPYWLTLHPNRLHTHLRTKLHMDDAMAGQVLTRVMEERAKVKSRKAKHTAAQRLWDEVLASARNELIVVRVLKAQTKAANPLNKAKWDALCAYEDVIVLWITRLKQVRRIGEQTPKQFADTLRDAGKPVANDGTHWTDYVPQRTRQPIIDAFNSLPPPPRGRGKTPFQRTVTPNIRAAQHSALAKEIASTLDTAMREREVTQDPDARARLDVHIMRLHEAQYRLDEYPKKQALPSHWSGLLS